MAKKGDTRFAVSYAPRHMFKTVDEANDGMIVRYFSKFDDAAMFAVDRAFEDFFGVCGIQRETCVSAKYNWWEDDATWHIEAESAISDYDINEPSYRH